MEKIPVIAIAAIGKNRELGVGSELIWQLSSDLQRFKKLTTANAVIMGRKTFDSIGKVLPRRVNVIVTRDKNFACDGCVVAHSVERALEAAENAGVEKIFIGGGGELYKAALPYTVALELTHVAKEEPRADVFFPSYKEEFREAWRGEVQHEGGVDFYWASYRRK